MSIGNFNKANRTITPKWLIKNEENLRFDLSIQRQPVWDEDRQSLFIHSLIYGYPVPYFYAQDTGDDFLWMLDGKQRFTTVISFIKDGFALSNSTPDVDGIEITGHKFSELPEDFQDEIKNFSFIINTFKNLSDEQRDEIFLRLNNGMSLTKMELTRVIASSKIMDFISEISEYDFFKKANISDKSRTRYVDQENVLQVISILINGNNSGFSSKEMMSFAEKLKNEGIPDNIQEIVRNITEYLSNAITGKEKFVKKVNIPIIYYIAVNAMNSDISPEKFGGFLQKFFKENTPGSKYSGACYAKSASKESIKTRTDELMAYYDGNIYDAPNYKEPEPKVTGRRGRPKTVGTQINIPSNNGPVNDVNMAASPGDLS